MAKKIPTPKVKTKMGFLDKLFAGIGGLSPLIGRDRLYQSMGADATKKARLAAQIAKYGKWGVRGIGLFNPWTAVPFGLMSLAQYGVGKGLEDYRDETGKIGEAGHAKLLQNRLAREDLYNRRTAARESGAGFWELAKMRSNPDAFNRGGLAGILDV